MIFYFVIFFFFRDKKQKNPSRHLLELYDNVITLVTIVTFQTYTKMFNDFHTFYLNVLILKIVVKQVLINPLHGNHFVATLA